MEQREGRHPGCLVSRHHPVARCCPESAGTRCDQPVGRHDRSVPRRHDSRRDPLIQDLDVQAPVVEDIAVPALVGASWSTQGLHTRWAFNGFMRLKTDEWLFTHGRHEWTVSNSPEALDYQRSFFDRFLKLDEHAMDDRPRVRLEVRHTTDEHTVRGEDTWPLPGTEYTAMYLDAISGELTLEKPQDTALTQC